MVTQQCKPCLAWISLCLSAITVACVGTSTSIPTILVPETIPTPEYAATYTSPPTLSTTQGGGGLEGLPSELFIALGGGGPAVCGAASDVELPAMEAKEHFGHYGYLCLWGFPPGEVVHLELYEPGGKLVAAKDIVAEINRGYAVARMQIEVWFPGLQTGEWRATASSSEVLLEDWLTVSEPDFPIVDVIPGSAIDVFGQRWLTCGENAYSADDKLVVFGAGLPPHQRLPFGIYHREPPSLASSLIHEQEVTTDDQGHFWLVLPVEASWPSGGYYYAVASTEVQYDPQAGGYKVSCWPGCFVITAK